MNEQQCVELQAEIERLQAILEELDNELEIKKKNFSLAVEDCREEEKLLNEMRVALDRVGVGVGVCSGWVSEWVGIYIV